MKKLKALIMLLFVSVVVLATFFSQYSSLVSDIESTAKSKEAQIDRYIDLSKGFIDLMQIYGDNFFDQGIASDSELCDLLHYDAESDRYDLDDVAGTKYQKEAGSLTGIGSIPTSGTEREELNLAFRFNQHFSSIYKKLPDVAWMYYTSKNDFINIYPWVSSDEFQFEYDLKEEQFFNNVIPENDPLRASLWTSVYLDHAGKGLMVTLSSPIYDEDTFMGAVSLDLTNDQLSDMISSKYGIYIVDDTDTVIANSLNTAFTDQVETLSTVLGCTQSEVDQIKNTDDHEIQRVGSYYIYTSSFANAPWRMVVRVPLWLIIGKAVLFSLPILAICILLLYTYFEIEQRKKTEKLLNKSMDELTSYQRLLENAVQYDFLTSTVNRRGLMEILNQFIEPKSIRKPPIVTIMGDVDLFKRFNDAYGHAAGDKVLTELAKCMQKNITSGDIVCRWGGEEFLIMVFNKTYEETLLIAERIRADIEALAIPWQDSPDLKATMTFGVAEYSYSENFEENIMKTDKALYFGKDKGRNQVVGYHEFTANE